MDTVPSVLLPLHTFLTINTFLQSTKPAKIEKLFLDLQFQTVPIMFEALPVTFFKHKFYSVPSYVFMIKLSFIE